MVFICLGLTELVCEFPLHYYKGKGKSIRVTGHRGPLGCETLRTPHFLDSRLTDGGEVVSLTSRPPFTPSPPRQISGTHFC
jgi:hypothetical protein